MGSEGTMSAQIGLRGHRVQNAERANARRREILVAAARIFARDGYTDATLDTIAAEMRVTKGVIYYHFRGKEEVLTEIRATAISESITRLEAIVARDEPPAVMLRAAIRDLVEHVFDDLDRYANILRTGQRMSDESRDTVRTLQRRYEGLIRAIVERGIATGVFVGHDPKLMTFTMVRIVLSITDWYSPAGRLSPDAIAEQVTEQVMRSVLLDTRTPSQLVGDQ